MNGTLSGLCLWLTGLCCSGKSTTARGLAEQFQKMGRQVTLLDGDVVRARLSGELGFSKADRQTHVRRVAFVAAEVVRHGGIAICAVVSPYQAMRAHARQMFDPGKFIEIYMDTALELCEQRDVKGLYAKARKGQVLAFTGVSDPYESPLNPELVLRTEDRSVEKNIQQVLNYLSERLHIA